MKRLLSLLLVALMLAAALSACSDSNSEQTTTPATEATETTAPTTGEQTEPTAPTDGQTETSTDASVVPTETNSETTANGMTEEIIQSAAEMIYDFYKPGKNSTVSADFTRPTSVKFSNYTIAIEWTVEGDLASIVDGEGDSVTVKVNSTAEVGGDFKLVGTISCEGFSTSIEFNYTVVSQIEVLNEAYALAENESLDSARSLTGVITAIGAPYDASFGNVTVTIVVNDIKDKPIVCYRMKGDGADTIKKGDKITVTGILKNYNGTIEFDSGCQLVSIDEVAPVVEPQYKTPEEIVNAAYALEKGDSLDDTYSLTGKITAIDAAYDSSYKNVSVVIVVGDMTDKPILCYRMKGTGADTIKVGDVITVSGMITNYNGKIEFTSGCALVKIDEVATMTDSDKVAAELAKITLPDLVNTETTVDLLSKGATYEEVTFTYASSNATLAVIENGKLTIKVAENNTSVTITVTAVCGEASTKKTFNVIIAAKEMTMEDIVNAAYALEAGNALSTAYTLTGVITKVNTAYDASFKNVSVTIQVGDMTDKLIQCYRMKGDGADTIKVGDTITVTGILKNYSGTIEFDAGCTLDSYVPDGGDDPTPGPELKTPEEIVNAAYALEAGEALSTAYTLTGVITKVNTAYDASFKNVTVTIQVGDMTDKLIQCFRMKGTGADTIKVGDTITVTGILKNYNGTIEYDAGCTLDSYVPGDGGDDPTPDPELKTPEDIVNAAYALEAGKALSAAYTLTGVITKVNTPYDASFKNVTVTIQVGDMVDKPIECYRMKGTGADTVKVGDTITVTGILKNYVYTGGGNVIEFDAGCTLDSIDEVADPVTEPPVETPSIPEDATADELVKADLGISGNAYTLFDDIEGESGAKYAGNAYAQPDEYIQIRSKSSDSGIVSTTSGGKIIAVIVTFNETTASGRELQVYASNTAYESAADLFSADTQGTSIGAIVYGSSTGIEITGDYAYVGVRSANGAIYMDSITFVWAPAE